MTTKIVEDLPDHDDITKDPTHLGDNSETSIISGTVNKLSVTTTEADIFLVTCNKTNKYTVYDVRYDEVIVKETERDSLYAKQFNILKGWVNK